MRTELHYSLSSELYTLSCPHWNLNQPNQYHVFFLCFRRHKLLPPAPVPHQVVPSTKNLSIGMPRNDRNAAKSAAKKWRSKLSGCGTKDIFLGVMVNFRKWEDFASLSWNITDPSSFFLSFLGGFDWMSAFKNHRGDLWCCNTSLQQSLMFVFTVNSWLSFTQSMWSEISLRLLWS